MSAVGVLSTRKQLTSEQMPIPRGARLLCELVEVEEKSEGGILLTNNTKQLAHTASQCMRVVAMGDMAYKDPVRFPTGPWCEEGQYVLVKPFAGVRLQAGDTSYRMIYDDMVECVIPDPSVVKVL